MAEVALEALREADPVDVILLDVMMPVMNGYEFREEQLKDPEAGIHPGDRSDGRWVRRRRLPLAEPSAEAAS